MQHRALNSPRAQVLLTRLKRDYSTQYKTFVRYHVKRPEVYGAIVLALRNERDLHCVASRNEWGMNYTQIHFYTVVKQLREQELLQVNDGCLSCYARLIWGMEADLRPYLRRYRILVNDEESVIDQLSDEVPASPRPARPMQVHFDPQTKSVQTEPAREEPEPPRQYHLPEIAALLGLSSGQLYRLRERAQVRGRRELIGRRGVTRLVFSQSEFDTLREALGGRQRLPKAAPPKPVEVSKVVEATPPEPPKPVAEAPKTVEALLSEVAKVASLDLTGLPTKERGRLYLEVKRDPHTTPGFYLFGEHSDVTLATVEVISRVYDEANPIFEITVSSSDISARQLAAALRILCTKEESETRAE